METVLSHSFSELLVSLVTYFDRKAQKCVGEDQKEKVEAEKEILEEGMEVKKTCYLAY